MTPARRAVVLVLGHAVLVQVLTYAMRPTLSYAVLETGASPALLGVVSAAFALPGLFLALPAGHALDRLGERSMLVVGSVALAGAAVLAAVAHTSVAVLLLATVLLGIGHLLSLIGQQALLANTAARGRSDSVFGFYTFAASLGQTLGPLLLLLPGGTVAAPSIQSVFIACAIIALAIPMASAALRSSPRDSAESRPTMLRTAGGLMRIPGIPQSLLATSIVMSSLDVFLAYLPALGQERGIPAALISAMLVTRSLSSMASRLFLAPMVRAVGRRRLLVTTIGLSAASLAGFALPVPEAWLVVLSAAYGFVVGTCQPITMSVVSGLAPSGTRGLAMSLRLGTNRIGQTVVPAALGALAAVSGSGGVLLGAGVLLAGAAWASTAVPDALDEEPPQPGEPSG